MDLNAPDPPESLGPPDAKVQLDKKGSVADVLSELAQLDALDGQAERRKKIVIPLLVASIIVGLISFPLSDAFDFGVFVGVGAALSVVGCIVFLVKAIRADIDDRQLDLVHRILATLEQEIRDEPPVELKVDFSSYEKSATAEDGSAFRKDWLELAFTLLDGTRVRLSVATLAKRKKRSKRKYTKIKDKVQDELTVTLKTPSGRALAAEASGPILDRLKKAARGTSLELKGGRIGGRASTFVFRTPVFIRIRARAGWMAPNPNQLLSGRRALAALILCYRGVISER